MKHELYKQAILRVLPGRPEVPLEAPPAESFDLVDSQTCPACGNLDARVLLSEAEDAVVIAKCPECQCEFPPQIESVSRKVIRHVSERRERRTRKFLEGLPAIPPGKVNRDDYALFRKIVDGEGEPVADTVEELPVNA